MIVLYAAVKLAAYSLWCWAGLRAFRPEKAGLKFALALGALRLCMGLFFGAGIFLAGTLAASALRSQLLVYLLVYAPVRWVEWALIDALIDPAPVRFASLARGADARRRGWRLRGILLSCLADLPMILSIGGLPLGRFMC